MALEAEKARQAPETAKARNFDFKFFAAGSSVGPGHYKNESMLVKKDSPIHSAQDLVGKKVGLNTLGNIAELEVRWWLGGAGVDTSKVKLVELNAVGPDEVPPLIQGRVDAIQVNGPRPVSSHRPTEIFRTEPRRGR